MARTATRVAVALGVGLSCARVLAETYCNENGTSAKFATATVSTASGDIVKIWSNNCPSRAFEDNVPAAFTSNCAVEQNYTYWIPATPVFRNESGNQNSSPEVAESADTGRNFKSLYVRGRIGLSRSNVMLSYPGTGSNWDDGDAMITEGTTFDYCGGHANPILKDTDGSFISGGYYHIHGQEYCLDHNTSGFGHSPLIGWMIDGFPLYGLYSDDGERADDLDACGGHASDSGANGGYHYHTTGFSGNMDGTYFPYAADSPTMAQYGFGKPYLNGCFKGCVPDHDTGADLGEDYQMESYADCLAGATAAPAGQLTIGDAGFSLASSVQINWDEWTSGQGSECPNPIPTSSPTHTAQPTSSEYLCSAAPTTSISACEISYGGECVSDQIVCERKGGTFTQPMCGSRSGSDCGCCHDMPPTPGPSPAPSPVPTPTPSPAPTITYECAAAPTHSNGVCSNLGGECVTDQAKCEAQGGTFTTPGCGSALGTGCGCCVPTSGDGSSGNTASLSLLAMAGLAALGVGGGGYFSVRKLRGRCRGDKQRITHRHSTMPGPGIELISEQTNTIREHAGLTPQPSQLVPTGASV